MPTRNVGWNVVHVFCLWKNYFCNDGFLWRCFSPVFVKQWKALCPRQISLRRQKFTLSYSTLIISMNTFKYIQHSVLLLEEAEELVLAINLEPWIQLLSMLFLISLPIMNLSCQPPPLPRTPPVILNGLWQLLSVCQEKMICPNRRTLTDTNNLNTVFGGLFLHQVKGWQCCDANTHSHSLQYTLSPWGWDFNKAMHLAMVRVRRVQGRWEEKCKAPFQVPLTSSQQGLNLMLPWIHPGHQQERLHKAHYSGSAYSHTHTHRANKQNSNKKQHKHKHMADSALFSHTRSECTCNIISAYLKRFEVRWRFLRWQNNITHKKGADILQYYLLQGLIQSIDQHSYS